MDMDDINADTNIFSIWYKRYRSSNNVHPNSLNDPLSKPVMRMERRNVIMPRICYFTRVTKNGIHQKLCLPYND